MLILSGDRAPEWTPKTVFGVLNRQTRRLYIRVKAYPLNGFYIYHYIIDDLNNHDINKWLSV